MATATSTRRAANRAPASGVKNGRPLRDQIGRVFRIRPARRQGAALKSAMLDLGVQGARGAVHLEVALNWFVDELPGKTREEYPPQGTGVYVHRRTPADRPGFPVSHGLCEWLDDEQCFLDRLPTPIAQDLAQDLRDGGDEAVWALLEQLYRERLG